MNLIVIIKFMTSFIEVSSIAATKLAKSCLVDARLMSIQTPVDMAVWSNLLKVAMHHTSVSIQQTHAQNPRG